MTEFVVRVANRPGRLAALAEAVASAGVNIESLAAFSVDDVAVIRMIVDDPRTVNRILREQGIPFEQHSILTTVLPNRPGVLAAMSQRLAASKVNIDAMYMFHTDDEGLHFAVAVDDPDRARTNLA